MGKRICFSLMSMAVLTILYDGCKWFFPRVDAEASEIDESATPIRGGNERILVVDDEDTIVESVRNMLQRYGYRVTALADSREALKLFKEDPSSKSR